MSKLKKDSHKLKIWTDGLAQSHWTKVEPIEGKQASLAYDAV